MLTNYNYYRDLKIDHTKIDSDLSDFSVSAKLTSSNFNFDHVRSDMKDVRFTKTDDTLLKQEGERRDAANSKAEFWVKVPAVSSSADTTIRMQYGNPDESSNGDDANNVWDSYFCYDKETEVLTDEGWKLFKDLNRTEKVATLNPKSHKLEFKKPFRYISYKYKGKLFRVKDSNQVDLAVIPEHRMYVADRKGKQYRLVKAKDIFEKQVRYKKDADWEGLEKKEFILPAVKYQYYTGNQYAKGIVKEKEIPEKRIKMDTWLEFLGYYLSEGYTRYQDTGKRRYTVSISQSLGHVIQRKKIEKCLKNLGFDFRYNGQEFLINNKQLAHYTKQFGKDKDRFIPKEIKNLSKRQLKILYEALMLGDGTLSGTSFSSISKKLADDFQEILLKIGLAGNLYRNQKNRKNPIYVIGIVSGKRFGQLRPHVYNKDKTGRKAHNEWEEYDDMVYSVEVENHIIYVRRNGKGVWSGNCGVWHMADYTTSTIKDSTSNGNNGTKKGANEPQEADGKIGKGQSFDGSNDLITIDNEANFDFERNNHFSIEVWVKTSQSGSFEPLVCKGIRPADSYRGYQLNIRDTNKIGVDFISTWDSNVFTRQGSTTINDNNWHHCAFTYDGSQVATGIIIYRDGANDNATTIRNTLSSTILNDRSLKIDSNDNFEFGGPQLLDEVRVSTTDRSAAWIKASYHSGNDSLLSYGDEKKVIHESVSFTISSSFSGSNFAKRVENRTLSILSSFSESNFARMVENRTLPILSSFSEKDIATMVENRNFDIISQFLLGEYNEYGQFQMFFRPSVADRREYFLESAVKSITTEEGKSGVNIIFD